MTLYICRCILSPENIHWASKETFNFLEWCPLKSTSSKWMIFGLMLATVLFITHVHSNSIAGYVINHVHNRFALQQTYCEHDCTDPAIEFEWITIEMSESLCGGKGAVSVILEKGLIVIWRHLSHFWHFRFVCFLTWVMKRTVANINPKIIHFDAVDFSGHHSKKLSVSFDAQCICFWGARPLCLLAQYKYIYYFCRYIWRFPPPPPPIPKSWLRYILTYTDT